MHDTDDLIPTSEAARILRKSVATVNRWAQTKRLVPAVELPGETGARLFRRSDVEALADFYHGGRLAPVEPEGKASA